ncbi:phosphate ABC transporter substrate-binding protein PstS [Kibdelosporangium phytohabitans]|uniref:Phosphate-binding protein n=1 Tax=Kibdelosporangium phytohabitans TaxID=860235 RepID=A0A0N9IFD2_9PSEU|nr:phosphate ABC transporter substrate-binding protein PstS [Kibdelosporangium phytohabitans]ALG14168.1 phosphate-binding protein [Kibdelosporangium phytohabitans]MBE1466843.1 phosphate transport system substrate-binding protein [Kibdelosporangium phytohabitans]
MKIKRHGAVISLIAAGALALTACGSDQNTPAAGGGSGAAAPTGSAQVDCGGKKNLVAEGSSAQKGAMDVFAQQYGQKCAGQQIAYTPSGSGNGIKQFNGGVADIGGSDSPLKEGTETDAAKTRCKGDPAWNLPLVFGPVAVPYKLDGVTDVTLTPDVIAKIFTGAVKTWDDAEITKANGGKALPAKPIKVIFRDGDSGTTDNFQQYLAAAAPSSWTKGAGKKFVGGTGQSAQGSAGVAETVAAADGTIGFVEWSFAQDKKLNVAKIDSGAGAVTLSGETAGNAIKEAKIKGTGNDLVLDLKALYASKAANSYPLVLATYEIVCSKGYDADTAKAVKAFLTVAATTAQSGLADAGYVPLPQEFQDKLLTAVKAIA